MVAVGSLHGPMRASCAGGATSWIAVSQILARDRRVAVYTFRRSHCGNAFWPNGPRHASTNPNRDILAMGVLLRLHQCLHAGNLVLLGVARPDSTWNEEPLSER
jgi:hypothetical protein